MDTGGTVNTGATEIAPAFFENPETGQVTLFYGSNRPGLPKDLDVYASVVGEDRYFGPGALVPEFSSAGRDTVGGAFLRARAIGRDNLPSANYLCQLAK